MKQVLPVYLFMIAAIIACGPVSADSPPNIPGIFENQDINVTATPEPTGAVSQFGEITETFIDQYADEGLSGSFLLAQNDAVVFSQGYGTANRDTNAPNGRDTVFIVGSIAKDFTRLSIMLLVDQGLLDYSDTLDMYLEDVPEDKQKITIQQLLDHQAGMAAYHDTYGDFQQMSRQEAFDTIMNTPLLFEPGTDSAYSNSGYTILAILIEEISGQSYMDFVRTQILEPLELNHTGYWGDTFDDMAYTKNDFNEYGVSSEWSMSWTLIGNGGMVSTVNDLYRFMTALINNELGDTQTAFGLDQPSGFAGGSSAHEHNAVIGYLPDENLIFVGLTNTREPIEAEFVMEEFVYYLIDENLIDYRIADE